MSHKCCCRLHYFNCQLLPLQLWLVAIASCCHSGLVGLAYSLRPLPLKNNNHKKCAAVCNKNVTAQNECCRHSCDNVHLATHKHIHLCGYDHASWKANYALQFTRSFIEPFFFSSRIYSIAGPLNSQTYVLCALTSNCMQNCCAMNCTLSDVNEFWVELSLFYCAATANEFHGIIANDMKINDTPDQSRKIVYSGNE